MFSQFFHFFRSLTFVFFFFSNVSDLDRLCMCSVKLRPFNIYHSETQYHLILSGFRFRLELANCKISHVSSKSRACFTPPPVFVLLDYPYRNPNFDDSLSFGIRGRVWIRRPWHVSIVPWWRSRAFTKTAPNGRSLPWTEQCLRQITDEWRQGKTHHNKHRQSLIMVSPCLCLSCFLILSRTLSLVSL